MILIEPDSRLNSDSLNPDDERDVVEKDSILSATAGIQWLGQDCCFSDWHFIPVLNLWRDFLPSEIEMKILGLEKGDQISLQCRAGDLLGNWRSDLNHKLKMKQFQPPQKGLIPVPAVVGRYYPSEFFIDVPDIYQGNELPCRITSIDKDQMMVDFNHPLAARDLEFNLRVESIKKAGSVRGGRGNDIPAMVCDNGPGMQDRQSHSDTDFWQGNPFSRLDAGNDCVFFKQPSFTPFWDRVALQQVTDQYNRLIPQHSSILDLMAGVHSPLQESDIRVARLTCAGLNQLELDKNPICRDRQVLDVNSISAMPFNDHRFDVVLIHAAIEYVINPHMLFSEIARVLKPGGKAIISFSNRSVVEKTIRLWSAAHEFERPAIVLSYLRSTSVFENFHSYSIRGQFRPEDDELTHRLLHSDPVYVIWAQKKSA